MENMTSPCFRSYEIINGENGRGKSARTRDNELCEWVTSIGGSERIWQNAKRPIAVYL